MTNRALIAAFAGVVLSVATAAAMDYSNHSVVRITPRHAGQFQLLAREDVRLLSEGESLHGTDYAVPNWYIAELQALGVPLEVIMPLQGQPKLALENPTLANGCSDPPADPRGFDWFLSYHCYDELIAFADALVQDRPELITKEAIGTSVEGRPLWAYTITSPIGDPATKSGVCFNGTQHAREWVSPPTVLYTMERLVRDYGVDPTVTRLLDSLVFYMVPVVNPDGYIYSWTTDRLWRKNRRQNSGGSFGVDLNRNWDFGWGLDSGSSNNQTSDTYRGPAPFSEPETLALSNFILARPNIDVHIDFHSYSQLILYPFGYASTEAPGHEGQEMRELAEGMAFEIFDQSGVVYVPAAGHDLYLASGIATDWVYGAAGPYSWTYELRPSSPSGGGFELPPNQIVPNVEEVWEAVRYLANWTATPLEIELPDGLPRLAAPNAETTFNVRISDARQDVDPNATFIYYKTPLDPTPMQVALDPQGADLYLATLPPAGCVGAFELYIAASSTIGTTVRLPNGAPLESFELPIGNAEFPYDFGFAADDGWTVGAPGDAATRGIWSRMTPEPTVSQPGSDVSEDNTECWITDGRAGSSDGRYDVDGGKTTLRSPVMSIEDPNAIISYWRWYSNDKGGSPNQDVFAIDVSTDGGLNWSNVEFVGPTGPEASGGWYFREFRMADIATPSTNVQFRFVAEDADPGSVVEAAIDEFQVTLVSCGAAAVLVGDTNCDGLINAADIDSFVLAIVDGPAYTAAYPDCNLAAADANEDGAVNALDIDPFVSLVVGG